MKNGAIVLPQNVKPRGVSKGDIGLMNKDGKLFSVDVYGEELPSYVNEESIESALGFLPVDIPLNKFDATVAPTVNDDSGDGYAIGSLWIDTVANEAYRCVDATVGAAIWLETTFDAVDVANMIRAYNTATVPTVTNDYTVPKPADGTYAGQKAIYHIKSSGGGNLTLTAGIKVASLSTTVFPFTLEADKVYIVQLIWGANGWMFVTLTGGFA